MTAYRLADKKVFLTGAASGIGLAAARRFSREGAHLAVADIDAERLHECADEIAQYGHPVLPIVLDITNEQEVCSAFTEAESSFGDLDVLFNCAGGSTAEDSDVAQLSVETFARTIQLDLQSVVLCCREAIPRMAKTGGSIINMSSWTARRGSARVHAYIAAKGGVSALTRAMASTYARRGVRVNAIAPGVVLTERAKALMGGVRAESLTFALADYPFATGEPEDIAAIALFLASDESRMITGHIIMADGGLSAY